MDEAAQYLISKDNGSLQIPYDQYLALMERVEEVRRIRRVKDAVLADLEAVLDGRAPAVAAEVQTVRTHDDEQRPAETESPKETAVPAAEAKPADVQPEPPAETVAAKTRPASSTAEVPPIKKDVEEHLNNVDESGRLLNVFRQYYTCLNDSCGSPVRVTMKDGICSLWNYDEWEEFAFVDIFEGNLRFAVDPRYTDELAALRLCEVPRLLSSRHNLVSVQMDDLNNTMLKVLTKAFSEVGMKAG